MTYALIALAVVFGGLIACMLRQSQAAAVRAEARIDALLEGHRSDVKALTDQIVLLKVEPQMAAIQAVPSDGYPDGSPYISPFDDDALADYEKARSKLEADTAALVEAHQASA